MGIGAADGHHVADAAGGVAVGQFQRARQAPGAADRARQHQPVIGGAHVDLFARKDFRETVLQLGQVRADIDGDAGDQPPALGKLIHQGRG